MLSYITEQTGSACESSFTQQLLSLSLATTINSINFCQNNKLFDYMFRAGKKE